MKESNFSYAFAELIKDEGGYVNDPNDVGGETNYGISKRSYPKVDIKNMTMKQARDIYMNDFWDPIYERINSPFVAGKIFSLRVHSGALKAHSILQKALNSLGANLKEDGVFGEKTLEALNALNNEQVLDRYIIHTIKFYLELSNNHRFKDYLRGWINRVMS